MTASARLFRAASSMCVPSRISIRPTLMFRGAAQLVPHEILENDADLPIQIFDAVLAEIDTVKQNSACSRIIQACDELDDRSLSLAVLANEGDSLAWVDLQIEMVKNSPGTSRIRKRYVFEGESLSNRPWCRNGVRFGADRRLHFEELDQIGQEQGLVGDTREGREDRLDVAARSANRARKELKSSPTQFAADSPVDNVCERAIVSSRAQDGQYVPAKKRRFAKRYVLIVQLIG